MDFETRDIDLWMQETLNSWAERGTLSSEKSAQLQMSVSKLASEEKKSRFTRKVCGLVAATITFIWLLFASCPIAAASYVDSPIISTHSPEAKVVGLFCILIYFFIKPQFQSQITNNNIGVNYD